VGRYGATDPLRGEKIELGRVLGYVLFVCLGTSGRKLLQDNR